MEKIILGTINELNDLLSSGYKIKFMPEFTTYFRGSQTLDNRIFMVVLVGPQGQVPYR